MSAWAQYTIRMPRREQVLAALRERGIPASSYYPIALHRQGAYRWFATASGGLPVSDLLAKEVLSLPIHAYVGKKEQKIVAIIEHVVTIKIWYAKRTSK